MPGNWGAVMAEAAAALLPDGPPLTPGELAVLLRVDSRTVSALAEAGKVASFRTPGGHRRFDRAEAERFAAGYRPEGDWASLADLAAAIRVSTRTARRWVKEGKVDGAVKDGAGDWLIPRATIKAMVGGGNG